MVLELCNCIFLVWLIRRKKFDGEIIGTYMIIYGIGRFFIEFVRGDEGRGNFLGWMSGTQAIAICLVIFGGLAVDAAADAERAGGAESSAVTSVHQ